jgi:heterodisulfide reductase subunit A2
MTEERRLGAFICYCGGNISDYVDVEKVRKVVAKDPSVVTARTNMFTCSDAAQQEIIKEIQEQRLDGIVIASCSPKLHLNTFRAMAERAGINPYQYTQVNIREQCSWTHTHDVEASTDKAIRLVRAGIAKTRFSRPLQKLRVETFPQALVIGAGVAGLRAALALSDMGIAVHVIEKSHQAGGMVCQWGKMFPSNREGSQIIHSLLEQVRVRDNISLFTNAELIEKEGTVGNFSVKVRVNGKETVSFIVGGIIVATGFEPYTPQEGEFGFGLEGVLTLPQFNEILRVSKGTLEFSQREVKTITYIYCVGSREHTKEQNPHPYCSRYCCAAASHAALCANELSHRLGQYHLFRDVRTYGKYELLYEQALNRGSLFIQYEEEEPPVVKSVNGTLVVKVRDLLTGGEELEINSDLVVLITGMVPRENAGLVEVLKLPMGKEGFFNEIHPKLRPVETVIDGVFIAGTAQGPKTMAESVTSSMAAVSKTGALLLKGYVDLEPLVARVNPELCTWCGACLEACPYAAIDRIVVEGKEIALVSAILCKGEGACVPVCPKGAIDVEGYSTEQIESMIDALVKEIA